MKRLMSLWVAGPGLTLLLILCRCGPPLPVEPGSEGDGDRGTSEASSESSSESPGVGSQSGATTAGQPDASGSTADDTTGVDAGDPEDVGPKKSGKLKLHLADAPISDELGSMNVHVTGVEFRADDGSLISRSVSDSVDLTQYQGGDRYELFSGTVPVDTYDQVRVLLDSKTPADLVFKDGATRSVFVPAFAASQTGDLDTGGFKALYGERTFTVREDKARDLTLHVDLWKSLRPIETLPAGWEVFDPDAEYWLKAEHPLHPLNSTGRITGVQVPADAAVACVYGPSDSLPLNVTDDCTGASGRALIGGNGTFSVPFVPPNDYSLHLVTVLGAAVEVPGAIGVRAGQDTIIDLSDAL